MEQKSWQEFGDKLKELDFGVPDCIIGIARGGIIPATIIAHFLKAGLDFIWMNRRDDSHNEIRKEALIYREPALNLAGKKVLLVEDRVKTGTTLKQAKKFLETQNPGVQITTCAVNGNADIAFFDESCFLFPWALKPSS